MPYLTPDFPTPNRFLVRRVRLPLDTDIVGIFGGAINELCNHWNFEKYGDMTPDETARMYLDIFQDYLASDGFMIGQITPYMTADVPVFCLPCDGGSYNRVDWPELYALLDPAFILDADTFVTPNLNNGSVPIGAGLSDAGTDFTVGMTGGEENHALTEAENGTHSHSDSGHAHSIPSHTNIPVVTPGEALASLLIPIIPSSTGTSYANIQTSGESTPHNNMSPYVVLKYCVVGR